MSSAGVFSVLPENFFSPLAGANRRHYAALLVLYYRLFQENTRGIERELVTGEFMKYLVLHRDSLAEEADEKDGLPERQETVPQPAESPDLDFGMPLPPDAEPSMEKDRSIAGRFLRRLIGAGWLGDETLPDFTRVVNITAWAKPFLESLVRVDEGLKTEYESHVVNVYSSICGETVKENGHFMVLNAREESRALIDSLKVLSQSIKGYYDDLNAEAVRSKAASVLHEHYDLYAGEVLDKAYKRLKTSDNVSRYRQAIFRQVADLLRDDEWLEASAGKYVRILQISREECRKKLEYMLEEIRDDLRAVDPLEDEIDRRNAAYSRSSTEIIKAYIEPDSTIAGKIGMLIKAANEGKAAAVQGLSHGLYRPGFLSPASLAPRRAREEGDFNAAPLKADIEALDKTEEDFFKRMEKRLSIKRIALWLDGQGGNERLLVPAELIGNEDSYIRFVYALLYGDSRRSFGYTIEEPEPKPVMKDGETAARGFFPDGDAANNTQFETPSVTAAGYVVPDVRFRKEQA